MTAGLIGYVRVSTERQGRSGLGLEAQRSAVEAYAKQVGARVVAWYCEIETGKRADRPQLARALGHAKRNGATVCVAKLDRLTRNAGFMCALCDSGARFVACDNPNINEMTAKILAVIAEHEAKAISERTRAALQAAKARGTLLGAARPGSRNLSASAAAKGRQRAAEARSKAAAEAYADLAPTLAELRAGGMSLHGIAARLNSDGHTTRRGRPWNAMQVARVLSRAS